MSNRNYIDLDRFQALYLKFHSIPTWTKNKHICLRNLMDYLSEHEHVTITSQHKNFPFRKIWDYDLYDVPQNIRGKLYQWRGKKILRMCINYQMYSRDKMICCPLHREREL